jgi:glycerophosphoryl diester phosphodiesterase
MTNSLEAVENAYRNGYRHIELDFNWTSDGHLVCIHDWGGTWAKLSGQKSGIPTLEQFGEVTAGRAGLTALDLPALEMWLDGRPEAEIVLDAKARHMEAYSQMAKSRHVHRLIPQAYDISEVSAVRGYGYERVILTLYRCPQSRREILNYLQRDQVFALTVPKQRLQRFDFGLNLRQGGMFTYAHTVNDPDEAVALRRVGASGFYTDRPQSLSDIMKY